MNYRPTIDTSEIPDDPFIAQKGFDYFFMTNSFPYGNTSKTSGDGLEEHSLMENNGGKRYNRI